MTERVLDDERRYVLLRRLADNPGLSQRELAKELGMGVGKVNYCLKALLDEGATTGTVRTSAPISSSDIAPRSGNLAPRWNA